MNDHQKIYAKHCAEHSARDLARVIKKLNMAVVGEMGALVIEAILALGALMMTERSGGDDENIDTMALTMAELAKRRKPGLVCSTRE